MDKDFKESFLNFDTNYKSTGEVNYENAHAACFGTVFSRIKLINKKVHNQYIIKMHTSFDYINDTNYNNYCPFSTDFIKEYLDELCKYIPSLTYAIETNVKEPDNKYDDLIAIHLDVNAKCIDHCFALTYVRYLYELPFVWYLTEAAYLKKKVFGFKSMSYLNLFNLVAASVPTSRHGCNIHAIGASFVFKKLCTITSIKHGLKNKNRAVNCIIDYVRPDANDWQVRDITTTPHGDLHTIQYIKPFEWFEDKGRKKRISLYKRNLAILKKIK